MTLPSSVGRLSECALLILASACTTHSAAAKAALAQLRSDPIVTFSAPSAQLLSRHDTLGGSGPKFSEPSRVDLIFSIGGAQPGDAVAAYEQEAKASGWDLVAVSCERQTLTVSAVFARDTRTVPVDRVVGRVLLVSEVVELHQLRVTLTLDIVPPAATATSAGLPRRDSGCLRGVHPADARRQPPSATSGRTAEQLCDLLREPLRATSADAGQSNRVLDLRPWTAPSQFGSYFTPNERPSCSFSDRDQYITILDAATIPLAAYEDHQYSLAGTDAKLFLLASDAYNRSDELYGAWIYTARGPVELQATRLPEQELQALARLVEKAASSS